MKRLSLFWSIFSSLMLIQFFGYHIEGQFTQCLDHFLTTDYHFVYIRITENLSKCIYDIQSTEEFNEKCPNTFVTVRKDLEIQLTHINMLEENYIKKYYYVYEKKRTWAQTFDIINIAEQLTIDLTKSTKVGTPWTRMIMQVKHESDHKVEYAYLFFVPMEPETSTWVGFIMIPYKNLNRSPILNETEYKKIRTEALITLEDMNKMFKFDLVSLWKKACIKSNGSKKVVNSFLLWSVIVVTLIIVY